jgi:hypothetical protein
MKLRIIEITDEEYHKIPAFSNSGCKNILKSPKHFKNNTFGGTVATRIGTLTHELLLRHDNYIDEHYEIFDTKKAMTLKDTASIKKGNLKPEDVIPKYWPSLDNDTARKKSKAMKKEAEGSGVEPKLLLHPSELLEARNLIQNVPEPYKDLLKNHTRNEFAVVGEINGVPVKVKLDAYEPTNGTLVDAKTTLRMSDFQNKYKFRDMGYDSQAYFYKWVCEEAGLYVSAFRFLVMEKDHIYGCKVIEVTEESLASGKRKIDRGMAKYKKCLESNDWTEIYPDQIEYI